MLKIPEINAEIKYYHDKKTPNIKRSISVTICPRDLATRGELVPTLLPTNHLTHAVIYRETWEDTTTGDCHSLARDITEELLKHPTAKRLIREYYSNAQSILSAPPYRLTTIDAFLAKIPIALMPEFLEHLAYTAIEKENLFMPLYVAKILKPKKLHIDVTAEDMNDNTNKKLVNLFHPKNRPIAHNVNASTSSIPEAFKKTLPDPLKALIEQGRVKTVSIDADGHISNLETVPDEFKDLVKRIANEVSASPDMSIEDKRKKIDAIMIGAGIDKNKIVHGQNEETETAHVLMPMELPTSKLTDILEDPQIKALTENYTPEQIKGLLTPKVIKALEKKYTKESVEKFISTLSTHDTNNQNETAMSQSEQKILDTLEDLPLN